MRKAKDKRIKKLKRKRIWPSILGLFIITTVFAVSMMIVLVTSVADVVNNKFTSGYETSSHIIKRYVEPNVKNLAQSYDGILADIALVDGIEAVSIIRASEKEWSSDGRYPDQSIIYGFVQRRYWLYKLRYDN